MRRICSILLLLCILGQASVRTLLVLHYLLDKSEYLSKCENKSRPNLHCDGKCYLKKQMGDTGDPSKAPRLPEQFRQIRDIQLYFESPTSFTIYRDVDQEKLALPPFLFSIPISASSRVFRPPTSA